MDTGATHARQTARPTEVLPPTRTQGHGQAHVQATPGRCTHWLRRPGDPQATIPISSIQAGCKSLGGYALCIACWLPLHALLLLQLCVQCKINGENDVLCKTGFACCKSQSPACFSKKHACVQCPLQKLLSSTCRIATAKASATMRSCLATTSLATLATAATIVMPASPCMPGLFVSLITMSASSPSARFHPSPRLKALGKVATTAHTTVLTTATERSAGAGTTSCHLAAAPTAPALTGASALISNATANKAGMGRTAKYAPAMSLGTVSSVIAVPAVSCRSRKVSAACH
jgi:hypothetical protein